MSPSGSFFKSTDADIGLEGKEQMAVYINLKKPLRFTDRADAEAYWKKNVSGYSDALNKLKR